MCLYCIITALYCLAIYYTPPPPLHAHYFEGKEGKGLIIQVEFYTFFLTLMPPSIELQVTADTFLGMEDFREWLQNKISNIFANC